MHLNNISITGFRKHFQTKFILSDSTFLIEFVSPSKGIANMVLGENIAKLINL